MMYIPCLPDGTKLIKIYADTEEKAWKNLRIAEAQLHRSVEKLKKLGFKIEVVAAP